MQLLRCITFSQKFGYSNSFSNSQNIALLQYFLKKIMQYFLQYFVFSKILLSRHQKSWCNHATLFWLWKGQHYVIIFIKKGRNSWCPTSQEWCNLWCPISQEWCNLWCTTSQEWCNLWCCQFKKGIQIFFSFLKPTSLEKNFITHTVNKYVDKVILFQMWQILISITGVVQFLMHPKSGVMQFGMHYKSGVVQFLMYRLVN